MTVLRALLGAFNTALHSFTGTVLILLSVVITAVAVLAIVGAAGLSVTGLVGLRLRRRASRQP